jgi:hypothetical protein
VAGGKFLITRNLLDFNIWWFLMRLLKKRRKMRGKALRLSAYCVSLAKMTDDPEVRRLLSDLKKWCDGERGRKTTIARAIGVDRRRVTDWLRGRVLPSLAMGLRVRAFLEAQPK